MTTYIAVATTPDDAEIRAAATYASAELAERAARHYADDGIGARSGFYAVPDDATMHLPDAVQRAYRALGAGMMRPHACRLCGGDGGELAGAYLDSAGMPYTLTPIVDGAGELGRVYRFEFVDSAGFARSVRLGCDDAERLVRRSTIAPRDARELRAAFYDR